MLRRPVRPLLFLPLLLGCWTAAFAVPFFPHDTRRTVDISDATLPDDDLKDEMKQVYSARDQKQALDFDDPNSKLSPGYVIDLLERTLADNGLVKDGYPLDQIHQLQASTDENERARLDVLVTDALLHLARDLHGDNYDLKADYLGWNFQRADADIPEMLSAALSHASLDEFLGGLIPRNPAYAKLAAALKTYESIRDKGGWGEVGGGPTLLPKAHDKRVTQLRERLLAEGYDAGESTHPRYYDQNLERAVTLYQAHNGLKPDGHIGTNTLEALNMPVARRIEQIKANMERWRQMPEYYPTDRYAAVNIADASIRIYEYEHEIYKGLVVVGKVDRKTPFIESEIRTMIVNPSWHVPLKIARKDILPKLKENPHYLEKLGFVISGNDDDPHGNKIDWKAMSEEEFDVKLKQLPGEQNSLGHLKFDFDNPFAVYMHGTPHQELFGKAQRNFSSGCVRLQEPDKVGEILLRSTSGEWSVEKIQAAVDNKKTRWITIKDPMPIYILYWTVFADDATGAINFRNDVYDYDRILEPNYEPPQDDGTTGP